MTRVEHTSEDYCLNYVEGVECFGVHNLDVLLFAYDEISLANVVDCLEDDLEDH